MSLIASGSAILVMDNLFRWGGWNAVSAIGTVLAFVVAFWSTKKSIEMIKKQLDIEQEPSVVVEDKIINTGKVYKLKIKNIGRGAAFRITCSKSDDVKHRDDPFFTNSEPHSRNLFTGEVTDWHFDTNLLNIPDKNTKNDGECYFSFYIFYKSQLGKLYKTKVKIKFLGDDFVVMENIRIKL